MAPSERFDAAYYRRFYGRRPAHDRRRIAMLATGVTAMAGWWEIPIRSVLDVGAGKGYWRDALAATHPRVRYHGIDASEYACRRYGHEHADVTTWEPGATFDLVICQSVLQYIDDSHAQQALDVLRRSCRGLLFFEAPTVADRVTVIDTDGTDLEVHWRSGEWYRTMLAVAFVEIGAGLWASRSLDVAFFELERAR